MEGSLFLFDLLTAHELRGWCVRFSVLGRTNHTLKGGHQTNWFMRRLIGAWFTGGAYTDRF